MASSEGGIILSVWGKHFRADESVCGEPCFFPRVAEEV